MTPGQKDARTGRPRGAKQERQIGVPLEINEDRKLLEALGDDGGSKKGAWAEAQAKGSSMRSRAQRARLVGDSATTKSCSAFNYWQAIRTLILCKRDTRAPNVVIAASLALKQWLVQGSQNLDAKVLSEVQTLMKTYGHSVARDAEIYNGVLCAHELYRGFMRLDGQTIASLELLGLDTLTAARLLPLQDIKAINHRLDSVEELLCNPECAAELGALLRKDEDEETQRKTLSWMILEFNKHQRHWTASVDALSTLPCLAAMFQVNGASLVEEDGPSFCAFDHECA
ncbi:hypothetical protein SELMODRAFT_446939 [Selaginella moellendorffii]|uniref:Uncharacterized protein n=1 Tax=Selaginella moellendorffii TaxID=88036 RepID=D8SVG2_SELML|nr:hypothetical protein SELMODRAFT_446939 [Selaginella moellendorffii]